MSIRAAQARRRAAITEWRSSRRFRPGDMVECQFFSVDALPLGHALNIDPVEPVAPREVWRPAIVEFCDDRRLGVRFADGEGMSFPSDAASVRKV